MGRRGLALACALLGTVLAGSSCRTTVAPGASPRPAPGANALAPSGTLAPEPTIAEASPPTPAAPAPATTLAYLAPGVHEQQLELDDQTRRWTVVVPERPDGTLPAGLVVVLHGVGGRGSDMRAAGFEPLAAGHVVVAYPDGLGGAWNDGRPGADPVVGAGVDDVRFLRLLIRETVARTGADPSRVAVVGFSNGAIMAGRMACDAADAVAAVAMIGGSGGQGFEQTCRPARPVAVMLVAGSNDRTVPYAGGRVADWGTKKRGYVAGVDDFAAFWRASDGCAATPLVAGSSLVSEARGADCIGGTAVLRYRVNGGGHEWFKPPAFDTTTSVWEFVTRRFAAAG